MEEPLNGLDEASAPAWSCGKGYVEHARQKRPRNRGAAPPCWQWRDERPHRSPVEPARKAMNLSRSYGKRASLSAASDGFVPELPK